jgi:hypothetical protein
VGSATPAELVAFAHAALFSPAISTLHAALAKGFIPNFPGLTAKTLRRYPPQSGPMIKGHLDQNRNTSARPSPSLLSRPNRPPTPTLMSTFPPTTRTAPKRMTASCSSCNPPRQTSCAVQQRQQLADHPL